MKEFNLNGDVEYKMANDKSSFLSAFAGSVAREVKKATIRHGPRNQASHISGRLKG